jgi:hypothetical protein
MAGLVTSKRIPNRDKDKPRILYSLTGNISYLITASDDFVDKKILPLSDLNRIVMKIWFFDKPELHYTIEKAFWKIEEHLEKITFLAIDKDKITPIVFYYRTNGKLELKPFTIKDKNGITRQILFSNNITSHNNMLVLHDPKGVSQGKERSGGRK